MTARPSVVPDMVTLAAGSRTIRRLRMKTSPLPSTAPTIAFVSADTDDARSALARLTEIYGQRPPEDADVIVVLGGDGFMLQTLRETMGSGKRLYGMNRGTIGFLMNEYHEEDLYRRIEEAVPETIRPLEMHATDVNGDTVSALAINEVSLFRQSFQAAKIQIAIDGKVRVDELICDGDTGRLDRLQPFSARAYPAARRAPARPHAGEPLPSAALARRLDSQPLHS
jgi:NAD kinase